MPVSGPHLFLVVLDMPPSGIGTDTGEGGVRYWPTPTPLPHTQHPHPRPPSPRCTALQLLLMRARRVDYWRHTRAPIPLPCSGHRGPVVRAPRGLEEPIEPPEPESPGGLCAAPQPVPVLCLCSGCATGQGMSGACTAAREVSPTTTGIQTGHQHVFAIWMHTSILSGHLGSLSLPLCLWLCL